MLLLFISSQEALRLVRYGKYELAVPSHLHVLGNSSWNTCSTVFLETKLGWPSKVPWTLLLSLLEDRHKFVFYMLLETCTTHLLSVSKIIEGPHNDIGQLAELPQTCPAWSFWHLHVQFTLTITQSSPVLVSTALPLTLPQGVETWEAWEKTLPVKTTAKAALNTSAHSKSFTSGLLAHSATS